MEKSFEDQMIVDTLSKLFKMGVKYVEKEEPNTCNGVGVPQGNPLSSLLVNVYLNEFDHFMKSLKKEVSNGILCNTSTE